MSYFKQAGLIFIILQLLFGYHWFRYKGDLFYILEQLLKPKYIFTSLMISVAYIFFATFLNYLFRPT